MGIALRILDSIKKLMGAGMAGLRAEMLRQIYFQTKDNDQNLNLGCQGLAKHKTWAIQNTAIFTNQFCSKIVYSS